MNKNTHTDDSIDVKELFFSLISQWKLIALCTLLSLVAALLYLRTTPEVYAVDALVQVEDKKGASAALLGNLSEMVEQLSPAQAEIEILKSRLILGSVIERLNLDLRIASTENSFTNRLLHGNDDRTDYQPEYVRFEEGSRKFDIRQFEVPAAYINQNLLLKIKDHQFTLLHPVTEQVLLQGALNQTVNSSTAQGQWKIAIFSPDPLNGSYQIQKLSLPAAVNLIASNFSVEEKGKMTGILGLNYQGEDKAHITQVLNAILLSYSQQNIERRSAETAQTLKFLDSQLPDLKKQLDDAERAFNQFRQQYNTVDVAKESELYLGQSIEWEMKRAELQQKQAEMAAKYTGSHPVMREINAQLGTINKKINDLNGTLKRLPEVQRQYLQLYREVEVKQQLYTALLNSYQQLRVAKAGEIGNVRIVDTAVEPLAPIKPKKLQILALALLAGLFLGSLLAALRNLLRSGIKDVNQIEEQLDLPVYATIPHSPVQHTGMTLKNKKTLPLLALKHNDDIAIESLRSMRTAIHFALTQARNNIIMISGPAPEVGKSFISCNLAAIMAQNNKRVLIIDADLRRGYLHKYFNRQPQPGLVEYLNKQNTLDQIIQPTDVPNLKVITRGKSPANPSELLNSAEFAEFLELLIPQYDHILIDTPPVLAVTDGIIVSQYAGVNLIVARYVKTSMKELALTVNRFEQAGAQVNGFILNDIQRAPGRYGYGYGYNYAYNYKTREKE
ncbi:polysaccharide biosynthesis tyrosine autokinase [Acinetobacter sp. GSS19]|uniref:polysaccharide biosynthesis tyrosine autokinase n=1 Tax=Acinetobacter sp. GSS19 TaxID=3020716 RepID=UPI00235F46C1|nr:polysaccharide biosynthesis tyrosine autokinase [Acinetobacter sp. GSS19]